MNKQSSSQFPSIAGSGHLRVTVTPNDITVVYIRAYLDRPGELAFTYTIR